VEYQDGKTFGKPVDGSFLAEALCTRKVNPYPEWAIIPARTKHSSFCGGSGPSNQLAIG
jgi:hypothetical protein